MPDATAGRSVTTRLRVRGQLEVMTPLHVGGLGHDPDVDLPVALDGMSRVYVPGTSLAGVLRSWMAGRARGAVAGLDNLWGFATDVEGAASRIFVRDGLVFSPDGMTSLPAARLESRTSVGIDRHTGTAARGFLVSRAVVPVGSYIALELDLESQAPAITLDRARLGALLQALTDRQVTLGAAGTRGLGRIRLTDGVTIEEHDLASRDGLLALLRGAPARISLGTLRADPQLAPRDILGITVKWEPLAPVMVRADRAGAVFDSLPLAGADGSGKVRLVLPGAGVKGALRSHAARILRTVTHERAPVPAGPPAGVVQDAAVFRAQLAQLPLAAALFGAAPDEAGALSATQRTYVIPREADKHIDVEEENVPSETESRPTDDWHATGLGALSVADCRSTGTIDTATWQRIATSANLDRVQRDTLRRAGIAQADHVAIDRWTGGAADGLLFTVAEPWNVSWEPLDLRVDLTRLRAALPAPACSEPDERGADDDRPDRVGVENNNTLTADQAVALLLLVLRDLRDGWVPLGGGTNRGCGDIRVTQLTVTDGGTSRDLADYLACDAGQALLEAWRMAWAAPGGGQVDDRRARPRQPAGSGP